MLTFSNSHYEGSADKLQSTLRFGAYNVSVYVVKKNKNFSEKGQLPR